MNIIRKNNDERLFDEADVGEILNTEITFL